MRCIDNRVALGYPVRVLKLARIFLCLWLAAFAAGSAPYAAGGMAMDRDMAMTSGAEMAMPGCDACGGVGGAGADGIACDIQCPSPVIALLPDGTQAGSAAPAAVLGPLADPTQPGRAGPPDPFPPKPLA